MRNLKTPQILATAVLFIASTVYLSAQPGNPSTPVPFGFLEGLVGAGALYGAYKIKKGKKQD